MPWRESDVLNDSAADICGDRLFLSVPSRNTAR
jgi:hypothetical protein